MLIVVALGGNALLQRGEPLEADHLRHNALYAARAIAAAAKEHQVVIVHGNGPQVGLLALQNQAYHSVKAYPFDILGAESQGMIGYVLQQNIGNYLPERTVATLLTQVIVDENDPAFDEPTKFIGPVYQKTVAKGVQQRHPDWILKPDGQYLRRVVPSPKPQHIQELDAIQKLLKQNAVVIAGGGGGVPCIQREQQLQGVEAVVDKDLTASLLARQLKADKLVILTDVDGVYLDFGTEKAKLLHEATIEQLDKLSFPPGSMLPKIKAACEFVTNTKQSAAIGHLDDLIDILANRKGTHITQ